MFRPRLHALAASARLALGCTVNPGGAVFCDISNGGPAGSDAIQRASRSTPSRHQAPLPARGELPFTGPT